MAQPDLSSEEQEWCFPALRCVFEAWSSGASSSGTIRDESFSQAQLLARLSTASLPRDFAHRDSANTLPVFGASWKADPGSSTSWTALETMC
jgi:hypothetical protein